MRVPIENVSMAGIIRDMPAHELPPEAWSDGMNIRFDDSDAKKILGETEAFGTCAAAPYFAMEWDSGAGTDYWMWAGVSNIYRTDAGGSQTNITRYTTTPGDNDYSAGSYPNWTGGILGGVPIINHDNKTDYPQQWDSGLSRMKDLDNWPANYYAKFVVPYKAFLVAGNLQQSGSPFPHTVLWSHPADPGTVPTSWDVSDQTKDAGDYPLSDSGGELVWAAALGDSLVLLKEEATWTMQWQPGPFVMRFDRVLKTSGVLAPNCAVPFFGQLFIVTRDDVILFDGKRVESIADRFVRRWLFNTMDPSGRNKVRVSANYGQDEIWIGIPDSDGSGFLDYAVIWNWKTRTWSVRELTLTTNFAYGSIVPTPAGAGFDAGSGVTFDNDLGAFAGGAEDLTGGYLLATQANGASSKLLQLDQTRQFNGTSYTAYLERTGLAVAGRDRQGNPKVDQNAVKFVRSVYPKVTGDAGVTLKVRVGSQYNLGDSITWEGPYTFDPATMEKIDCRVSGKYIAVRFEGDTDKQWKLQSYALDLDVVSAF